ncbi:HEAT repeat domain-containing protein [Streptomyces sp. NRRL S-1448]|uniref:HEAT repeat domain-containing protein n=1 Tax=Streptomyces sp. NRRL S-1448 TaxID=1463883 RepID=UPI000D14366C|nr:HEAT repeat domain-containing protein [Streptomyces sp. NRRL S-1448]
MNDVDWAELTHAYGTAEDVPGLLHDLRSDEDVTRERALDALYGGVHHQGDVYDSTLACIPHLLALVQDPDAPDRGPAIGLLTSIGATAHAAAEEAGDTMPDPEAALAEAAAAGWEPDEWWEEYACAHGLLAGRALAAAVPSMVRLLTDADPDVRAAAATFLVRCADEPAALLPTLTGCLHAEADPTTRQSLVEDLADLLGRLTDREAGREADREAGREADRGTRSGARTGHVQAAVDLLRRLATGTQSDDATTVLTALTALAAHAPDALPPHVADRAIAALDRASGRPAPPPESGPDSGTMLSYLRDLRAQAYPEAIEARLVDAVQDLHGALGGRLHDRHRLVSHDLRRTAPCVRSDVFDRVRELYGGWRVPKPEAAEAAALLGGVLVAYAETMEAHTEDGTPEDGIPEDAGSAATSGSDARVSPATPGSDARVSAATAAAAAEELRCCCLPLTADILDAAHRIADASGYRTGHGWERDAGGECLQLLVAAGDERGARLLGELLYGRALPEGLPGWCRDLGPHAAGMLPQLGARLQQIAERTAEEPGDDHALDEAARLLSALRSTGFDESAGVIAPFLDALAEQAEKQGTGLHRAGIHLLASPDGLGPDAADHTALLCRLLADPSPYARVGAARALWHAGQDAAEILPVLTAAVENTVENTHDWHAGHQALELAAVMGPAATPLAPAVRACLDAPHAGTLTAARAALALRAITAGTGNAADRPAADRTAADAALLTAWQADRSVRSVITAGLHREDPATPLPPGLTALLRDELADLRRLDNPGRPTRTRFRHNTAADEGFCAQATALLARA